MNWLEEMEENLQQELELRVNQFNTIKPCEDPNREETFVYDLKYHFRDMDIAAEMVWPSICDAVFEMFEDEDALIDEFGEELSFLITLDEETGVATLLIMREEI